MQQPDIAVFGEGGELYAVVQVKRKLATTARWAADLRRNLLVHGAVPGRARWFVVATPDAIYLWDGDSPPDASPSSVLDAVSIFEPLLQRVSASAASVAPEAFEMLVATWLSSVLAQTEISALPASLRDLAQAVRRGRIEVEEVA